MTDAEPASASAPAPRRKILHVGCGTAPLPASLPADRWEEIRYDIDPAVRPHLVGSMLDMGVLADGSVDGLYSSHNVEHLQAHEVAIALGEFRRVLKPGGTAWIIVPDLQLLAERLAAGDIDGELYVSASGPITVSDVLWGHRASLSAGQRFMAHRYGFSAATFERHLLDAGFGPVRIERHGPRRELIATATRPIDPAVDPDRLFEQARSLHNAGRWAEAQRLYVQVAQARPRHWPAQLELGSIHCLLGPLSRAIEHVQRALALEPQFPRSHLVLGQLYAASGRPAEALDSLRRAIELDPTSAAAHHELAKVCLERQAWSAAEAACREALRLQPTLAAAGVCLAQAVSGQGRVIEGLSLCRAALAGSDDAGLHGQLLPLLAGLEATSDADLSQAVQQFNQRFAAPLTVAAQPIPAPADRQRRLRIGYLSGGFQRHAMRHFVLPVLQQHDRGAFEVWCYHDSTRLDDVTALYRAQAEHWVPCHALSDEALAERIRADGIDVLVDLMGPGEKVRRMVMARRAAPLQVSHPCFGALPATSGVDLQISDRWLGGPGGPQGPTHLHLAGAALCFAPAPGAPAVSPSPFERQGAITLGVVAPASRLQAGFVQTLAQVLSRAEGTRLCFQCSALQIAQVRQALTGGLGQRGVAADRLQFRVWADGSPDLAVFHDIDILLDTFPQPGVITTCDALWMGVPVVTRRGPRATSRVGASLLHAAGLGELVAADADAFVDLAVALACDRPRLRELRQGLRQQLSASTLTDTAGHRRALEAGLRSAWQRWCATAPDNLSSP